MTILKILIPILFLNFSVSFAQQIVSPPDVINQAPDTSAFAVKGAITIGSKNIANYLSQLVIVSGYVSNMSNKIDDNILLEIGSNQQTRDFTIVIKKDNIKNFDMPSRYNHKRIKVSGTVILYNREPAIEINDDRYIQILH